MSFSLFSSCARRNVWIVLFLLLPVLFGCGRGKDWELRENLERNLSALSAEVEKDPLNPFVYYVRGKAYASQEKWELAFFDLDRALSLIPDYVPFLYHRALVLENLGKRKQALQDLTRAVQLQKDYAIAYLARADLLRRARHFQKAILDYDRALNFGLDSTKDALSYYGRGLAYQEMGLQNKAVLDFSSAISMLPNWYKPYFARGNSFYLQEDFLAARLDFEEVIYREPRFRFGWDRLLQVFEKLDDTERLKRYQDAFQQVSQERDMIEKEETEKGSFSLE